MRLLLKLAVGLLALAAIAVAVSAYWLRKEIERPYKGYAAESRDFAVSRGESVPSILARLEEDGIVSNRDIARIYLVWKLEDASLKAGEYRFSGRKALPAVLDILIRGQVLSHPVTVPEGLTLEETARQLESKGFGTLDLLLSEMHSPSRISDLDAAATNLEGYLFPDTYTFPRGTSEAAIVDKLVGTFRSNYEGQLSELLRSPSAELPDLRSVVTLASIVEKEAQLDEERPLIAGVYANRLRRGIALYADPTIIYGLKLMGRWDGNIRRSDLDLDSPYNTYRRAGLPPGPIASPGLRSLLAAARPAEVPYLYFVSRNDGTHVFATTLSEHNRNVYRWQKLYWQQRRNSG